MGAQSKISEQRKVILPVHEGSMQLCLKVWLYAKPEQCDSLRVQLANSINARTNKIKHQATWTAEAKAPPGYEKLELDFPKAGKDSAALLELGPEEGDKVFSSLIITLTTKGIDKPRDRKQKTDMFEDVLTFVNELMRDNRGAQRGDTLFDIEGHHIICWLLRDPLEQNTSSTPNTEIARLAVWVLPSAGRVVERPAEKIEEFLHGLVCIKQKKAEKAYRKPLAGRAVLKTIEDQLYHQKTLHDSLLGELTILKNPQLAEGTARKHVKKIIKTLEDIDKTLTTLVHIYEQNVGRIPDSHRKVVGGNMLFPKYLVTRLARVFTKQKEFGTIAIDDKTLEELKSCARRELRSMQRVAPIIAAHVRLYDSRKWKELREVCELASTGPEQSELPGKLAIVPENIGNKQAQAASLERVAKFYETSHEKVLDRLEALDKNVGKRFAEEGGKIFRDRKDRNHVDPGSSAGGNGSGKKKGLFKRLIAKLTGGKTKKLEVIKGVDSDADSVSGKSSSKEEWCEKV